MALLVEVGVLAGLAQLVVMGDGLKGDVSGHVELLDELLDGVGALVVVGRVLHAFLHGLGVGSRGVGGRGAHGAEAVPEHAAAELERSGVVSLEVGVENRPGMVGAAIDHDADALALHPGCLVHEALALGVDEEEGAMEHAGGLGVHHRGPGSGLESGADPGGHVVAIADVAQIATEARLHLKGDGSELLEVLIVPGDVTRGQDDALGGVVLHVVAIGVLADGTRHDAGLILHELNGRHVEHDLGAGLLGCVGQHVLDGLGITVLVVEVATEKHVVAGSLRVHGGVGANGEHAAHAVLLSQVEQPVHAALGLAEELANNLLVAAVAASGDPTLHLDGLVEHDTVLVHHAALDGTGAAHAMAVEDVVLLDQDGVEAVLGSVAGAGAARIAAADDEHVAVDGLGDLGDRLRLDLPAVLASGRRGLIGRGNPDHAQCGDSSATSGSVLEKVATRDRAHVQSSLHDVRRPLRRV